MYSSFHKLQVSMFMQKELHRARAKNIFWGFHFQDWIV